MRSAEPGWRGGGRSLVLLALCGLAGLLAARTAAAQTFSMDEYAARQIARLALFDLRLTPEPGERDYRIASLLLELCEELRPADQEILRRRIEAAWAGGDNATVIRESERLLVLDPADTVALLRLLTFRISALQTAEERIAAYDRFLDTDGRGRLLDPAIRSRLALDAALLHRERGQEEAFVSRLEMAIKLDSTHKEAATLAAAYAAGRVGALERLELLSNVLIADPVDPNVHLAIARELAIGGAYRGTRRFLANARSIAAASGGSLEEFNQQDLILKWYTEGPHALVQTVNADRMRQMESVAKRLQQMQAEGIPIDREMKPEDVQIAPTYAFLSAIALDAIGDREATEAMVAALAGTSARLVRMAVDPQQRPANLTEQQALVQAMTVTADLQIVRLWTGTQPEGVRMSLAEDSPLIRFKSPFVPLLQAWLKLRSGDAAGAAADLAPMADGNPVGRIAYAQALEATGDIPRALEQYERIVREGPLTGGGAWARYKLGALGVRLDRDRIEELERWADAGTPGGGGVPEWVDRAVDEPPVRMSARLDASTCEAVDGTRMTIVLENLGSRPLALGPDRPISSRLLIAPKLDVPLGPLGAFARPEVIDLDRRLRLMPRERLEVQVWPDAGESGWLLEVLSGINMRVRWRVIQGFWIDPQGGYRPGPMSVQTESPALVRRSLPEAVMPAAEYPRKIAGDPEELLPRTAAAVRTALMVRPVADGEVAAEPPQEDPAIRTVGEAWSKRWERLSPPARLMVAATVPSRQFASGLSGLDDTIRAEKDPRVMAVALVTRVTDPADDYLKTARSSENPRVAELARLVQDRLTEGVRVYATMTPRELWAGRQQAEAPPR